MRTQFVLTLGQSLVAASLPGIGQIRGIVIDNPTGQWMQLFPGEEYVRPYIIGFAKTFAGGITSLDLRVLTEGPGGQVSTQVGGQVLVTLDSEPVGTSLGSASGQTFIEQFTPIRVYGDTMVAVTTGSLGPASPVILPNERVRLLTFEANYIVPPDNTAFPGEGMSPVSLFLEGSPSGVATLGGFLSPDTRSFFKSFGAQGIDYELGDTIQVRAESQWADEYIAFNTTYQVI